MLVKMLYPNKCIVCGKIISEENAFCQICGKNSPFIRGSICLRCGKPIDEEMEICLDCSKKTHHFVCNRSVFMYEGNCKKAMYDLKYSNHKLVAKYFASQICEQLGDYIKSTGVEGIVPIPLHKKRLRRRGYNQSELIAVDLGRMLEIPVYCDELERSVKTRPQKELNGEQRKNNVKNAFKIGKNAIQLKRIMLLDDIYTTGATLDAAARTLQEYGVEIIYAVTVCVGNGY